MSMLAQIEDFTISSKSHLSLLLKLFLPELFMGACSDSDKLTQRTELPGGDGAFTSRLRNGNTRESHTVLWWLATRNHSSLHANSPLAVTILLTLVLRYVYLPKSNSRPSGDTFASASIKRKGRVTSLVRQTSYNM